jgi:hypothetical protein
MAVQCVLVIGFVASFVAKAIHDVQYYRAWLATENTPLIAGFMRTELISDLFWNPLIVLVLFGPQFVLLCGRAAKNAFRP